MFTTRYRNTLVESPTLDGLFVALGAVCVESSPCEDNAVDTIINCMALNSLHRAMAQADGLDARDRELIETMARANAEFAERRFGRACGLNAAPLVADLRDAAGLYPVPAVEARQ